MNSNTDQQLPILREMTIRDAIRTYGLESLRGRPITDSRGTVYISDPSLNEAIELWSDEAQNAHFHRRFYGGEERNAKLVRWIYRSAIVSVIIPEVERASAPPDAKRVDLADPAYIGYTKAQWGTLPRSMIVIEYCGSGDAFFGGTADDRTLGVNGRIVEALGRGEPAEFATIEQAHAAAVLIPNRRPNSTLGVAPVWN